jgi:hypothetical protein
VAHDVEEAAISSTMKSSGMKSWCSTMWTMASSRKTSKNLMPKPLPGAPNVGEGILWPVGNDVGIVWALGATFRFGNPDNTLDNEENTNKAPKVLIHLTGDSPDIIGSFDHLHIDPPRGGNERRCSPQPAFTDVVGC